MPHRLVAVLVLFAVGCGGGSGGGGPAPTSCPDVVDQLCAQGAACANNGKASIWTGPLIRTDYMSISYCTTTLTDHCGPQAPSTDVPLIRDPVSCGQALASAPCMNGGLTLPTACGGP
jgi:hypothetical protein